MSLIHFISNTKLCNFFIPCNYYHHNFYDKFQKKNKSSSSKKLKMYFQSMALVVHNKGRRAKKGKSLLKAKISKGKFLPRLEFPEEWGVLNNKLSRRKRGTCIICFNWEMHITNPTWISTRIITHWLWHHFTSIWWCCIFLRILIKVFLWYNSLNINKNCIISLTYKELLSFKFAASSSTLLILIKLKHREKAQ